MDPDPLDPAARISAIGEIAGFRVTGAQYAETRVAPGLDGSRPVEPSAGPVYVSSRYADDIPPIPVPGRDDEYFDPQRAPVFPPPAAAPAAERFAEPPRPGMFSAGVIDAEAGFPQDYYPFGAAYDDPAGRPARGSSPAPPGSPGAPDFAYWKERPESIRERRYRDDKKRRESADDVPQRGFKSREVPSHVHVPKFEALRAVWQARREERKFAPVPPTPPVARPTKSSEKRSPSYQFKPAGRQGGAGFKSRPVPWGVSAPLYEQKVLAEESKRAASTAARSKRTLREASLPPRLEAVRQALSPGPPQDLQSTVPVPTHQAADARPRSATPSRQVRKGRPPPRPASGSAIHQAAAVVGGAGPEGVKGPYQLAGMATPEKTKGGPVRTPLQYNTTEVPDFEAHHERFRQACEKFKHERRTHTVPQPFMFHASKQSQERAKSARARNLKQQPDPSESLAWKKPPGRGRSVPSLQRPPVLFVPGMTEKQKAFQNYTQSWINKRREDEMQAEKETEPPPTRVAMKSIVERQVREAIDPKFSVPLERRIDDKVRERHKDLRRGDKKAELKVKDLYEEAARMPLLMERSSIQSWKTRSRVRALAKMQKALENNGLKKEIRSKDLLNEDELDDAADYAS